MTTAITGSGVARFAPVMLFAPCAFAYAVFFIWPQASGRQTDSEHDGYNMAEWSANGLVFWAVSDVSAGDLAAFRSSFIRAAAGM